MAVPVHLPKVGMTMEEGTLTRWAVAPGTRVRRGTVLFEMETEKVEMDVEADGDGTLQPLVDEGTRVQPGAIVGCLLAEGESAVPPEIAAAASRQWSAPAGSDENPPIAVEAPHVDAPPPAHPEPVEGRIVATPIARKIAAEHGFDLRAVSGTGPDGRITERDVRAAIDALAAPSTSSRPPKAAHPEPVEGRSGATLPYAGRRRTIGERMHQSLQSSAQLTLSSETRVDDAMRMLHGLNREWRGERVVVTLTALVVRACGLALREHPALNARLDADRIVREPVAHVGFAVDLDDGLMVPVVRDAAVRPLQDVARAVADLNERAKSGALSPDDVTGGTFTVTSLEGSVVDAFTPILNAPQAAILGVGRVREVPVFEEGAVARGQVTTLSLTFDHRLVDGGPASRFLGRVAELLARPYLLT